MGLRPLGGREQLRDNLLRFGPTDVNTCKRRCPSGGVSTVSAVNTVNRIDLLELDIDLRLTELWREAAGVEEWSLEVVSAFMRAAYGKGYCDALTEEEPGSLCLEHGYEIPSRRSIGAARDAA
jgi:hypothetical protein